jgi:hypothetical protein
MGTGKPGITICLVGECPEAAARVSTQLGPAFVGCDHGLLSIAPNLAYLSALFGVLQNDAAPMIIDNSPFFDLL